MTLRKKSLEVDQQGRDQDLGQDRDRDRDRDLDLGQDKDKKQLITKGRLHSFPFLFYIYTLIRV